MTIDRPTQGMATPREFRWSTFWWFCLFMLLLYFAAWGLCFLWALCRRAI